MQEDVPLHMLIVGSAGLLLSGVIIVPAVSPVSGATARAGTQDPGQLLSLGEEGPPTAADSSMAATVQTDMGNFLIGLYWMKAQRMVEASQYLAANGFYDGLTFHRVDSARSIQGGSPTGEDDGGPGFWLRSSPPRGLRHDSAGVVSMVNTDGRFGSQFLITWGWPASSTDATTCSARSPWEWMSCGDWPRCRPVRACSL